MKAGEINSFTADLRIFAPEGQKWTRINVMKNTMNTDAERLEMICVNYDVTELKSICLRRRIKLKSVIV